MIREAMKGAVIASTVFSLFASGTALASEKAAQREKESAKVVKCAGVNSCKGKGFTEEKSEKACVDKGGKVLAASM
ncbi:hypothetical protein [Anaeromyxobacter sp. Fw109-5]|uniref:hypothetical protein n=1 Tax=Anaeromyxobacter sp. (strain Fw109-5) TaxID=404589 RepID=UPI000158A717|nr:hypothetical protein [Anaeromyxobacter sp. Fw109-5]ABS25763.1 hypothetical protein Anae109_1559 [Anaeromyxobacter sp. Fw109-5]